MARSPFKVEDDDEYEDDLDAARVLLAPSPSPLPRTAGLVQLRLLEI
jgi:hypothetical protein